MYAAKISQTVAFENPLSAQAVACVGAGRTRPRTVATNTPSSPMAAPGIGSVMMPVIVARKRAKKCHAFAVSPSGVGTRSSAPPITNGATTLSTEDCRERTCEAGEATSAATDWTFIPAQDTTVIGFPHETPHVGAGVGAAHQRRRSCADAGGAPLHPGRARRLLRVRQRHHRNALVEHGHRQRERRVSGRYEHHA